MFWLRRTLYAVGQRHFATRTLLQEVANDNKRARVINFAENDFLNIIDVKEDDHLTGRSRPDEPVDRSIYSFIK
jgi:hypothetical protein